MFVRGEVRIRQLAETNEVEESLLIQRTHWNKGIPRLHPDMNRDSARDDRERNQKSPLDCHSERRESATVVEESLLIQRTHWNKGIPRLHPDMNRDSARDDRERNQKSPCRR